ncbi:hypothetical protein [Kitasatospora kifunensis]|uniref:Uncharacterized protein n=1 Tax=Kitasatospora kifunensis TaxID=58351 RepID=A0A7W7W022_KITKI|nr:hypothetical protein [Kitasatospora kifunensis]MBB4929131.1 hypothetical protein [Kitasatospora kifunensis]
MIAVVVGLNAALFAAFLSRATRALGVLAISVLAAGAYGGGSYALLHLLLPHGLPHFSGSPQLIVPAAVVLAAAAVALVVASRIRLRRLVGRQHARYAELWAELSRELHDRYPGELTPEQDQVNGHLAAAAAAHWWRGRAALTELRQGAVHGVEVVRDVARTRQGPDLKAKLPALVAARGDVLDAVRRYFPSAPSRL